MRILLSTDAFPPVCGGSGWSTYELAKTLRASDHHVVLTRPRVGPTVDTTPYDDFQVVDYHAYAPRIPFVRNYFKNERLYRRYARFLRQLIHAERIDIVHGQHVLSGPSAIVAARAEGVPVVCTIRDDWPICYWSDLMYDFDAPDLCPRCTPSMMARCVRPRAGAAWPLTLPMIPYMRANLSRKQSLLGEADAIIAVSSALADDLRVRSAGLTSTRLAVIPNPVDVTAIRAEADRQPRPSPERYAIYVGKLEPNKGVRHLVAAIERANVNWPVIVVGDGSERGNLERIARRSSRDVRFTGWRSRAEVLGWLRHTQVLVFPSSWPESLSRVLLEASALGVPIAAMDTGGTRDIITHEVTGLLSRSADGLGDDLARLSRDEALRRRLGQAASRHVEANFDATVVVQRVEALYQELIGRERAVKINA